MLEDRLRAVHDRDKPRTLVYYLGAPLRLFFRGFNWAFGSLSHGYAWLTSKLIRIGVMVPAGDGRYRIADQFIGGMSLLSRKHPEMFGWVKRNA